MKNLKELMPLFSAIIAFCSVFVALGLVFNMLLGPVKKDIETLKIESAQIKKDIKEVNRKLDKLLNGQKSQTAGHSIGKSPDKA